MKKETKYYIAILVVVVGYLAASFYQDINSLSVRVTTVTTLIAAVAFWLQFKRTEQLNEAEYILNLNNQFVKNKDMTRIEHKLEIYHYEYEQYFGEENNKCKDVVPPIKLHLDLELDGKDRQKLINYLVYLEALAAIVEQKVLHIDIIDNLFAYRFFLAVNNPVVQKVELLPFREYYKGIINLSKEWTKLYDRKGMTIPMQEYNLADLVNSAGVGKANLT